MRKNSDFIWSFFLVGIAILFFYFGNLIGSSRSEKEFYQEIEEKNERIKILDRENRQLSELLTSRGILSYPQASIIPHNQDEILTLLIMLNGQQKLTDFVVKRNIISNYSQVSREEARESMPAIRKAYLGILKLHTPASFDFNFEGKEVAVELSFESGKTKWKQTIRARKTPSGSLRTFWVITNVNNLVIDKHIDEGFPLEEDGSIFLWKDEQVRYSDIEMNSTFKL